MSKGWCEDRIAEIETYQLETLDLVDCELVGYEIRDAFWGGGGGRGGLMKG